MEYQVQLQEHLLLDQAAVVLQTILLLLHLMEEQVVVEPEVMEFHQDVALLEE
tara:strand:- start:116 stop:274 length:159 start_codon:yes stop_codon:yes gene_type:complete